MSQMITTAKRYLDPTVVVASVVLLVALSVEIIGSPRSPLSIWYINLQGVVCAIFLIDFTMLMLLDREPLKYFFKHIIVLIISLPYLSILPRHGTTLHDEWALIIGVMPQLRSFLALYIVLRWIVRKPTVRRLFCAYILTVATLTYIAALLFYSSEVPVNKELTNFGDAIWWSAMGLTTVGTSIMPVTATGKILSVVMPLLGMMMLPISTSYLINIYRRR